MRSLLGFIADVLYAAAEYVGRAIDFDEEEDDE